MVSNRQLVVQICDVRIDLTALVNRSFDLNTFEQQLLGSLVLCFVSERYSESFENSLLVSRLLLLA